MNAQQSLMYQKADLGKRLIALIIDTGVTIMLLFMGLVGFIFDNEVGLKIFLAALLFPLYYLLFKDSHLKGQSYGKRYMGLIVIDFETNKPWSKKSALIRQLILVLLSLIECIITLLQGEGRRLGDFVAKTQVIEIAEYEKRKNTQIS